MISSVFFTDPPRCTPVKPRTNPPLAAQCSPASDRRLGRFADRHWGVSWPPVGTFVTAYGENLMTADSRVGADLADESDLECAFDGHVYRSSGQGDEPATARRARD